MTHAPEAGPSHRRALLAIAAGTAFEDTLVYGLIVPFMPAHAERIGLDDTGVALLLACYGLGGLVSVAGVRPLARRFGARAMMLAGLVGLALATLAFWLAEGVPALFGARAAQGAAAGVAWTLGPAMVAERFGPDERGAAMGLVVGASAVGFLCGPAVGGALYSLGGYGLPFAVVLVTTVAFAGVALVVLPKDPPRSPAADDREPGFAATLRRPPVRLLALLVVAAAVLLSALEPIVPLLLHRRFETSAWVNGLVFSAALLVYSLLSPLVGRASDRVGRLNICAIGLATTAVTYGAVALAPSVIWAAVAMGAVGITIALTMTPTMPAMADLLDGATAGRDGGTGYVLLYQIYNLSYGVGVLLGPLVAAGLLTVSATASLVGLGGAASIAGLALMLHVRAPGRPPPGPRTGDR